MYIASTPYTHVHVAVRYLSSTDSKFDPQLFIPRPDEKIMLLLESGCRMHATEFDLPKNIHPSGFSMKVYTCMT